MRRTRWLRWAACLTLAALVDRPARSQAPKPQAGEKYALLVGVRQYDPNELRPLPYAEPDVEELAALFRDAGYRRVVTMTIAEGAKRARLFPMGANIRKELAGLLEDCEPADTVLVVFAGHGVQFRGEDVNYFCPMDARLADRSTLISLKDVYRDLEGCKAGTRLMLVDACRNDPQSDNSRSRSSVRLESVTRPQQDRPPGGIAALFSCSEGQKAYEHDALKHGVFFHFVIQGLRGEADFDRDGGIDLEELALYARKRVPAYVKDEYGPEVRQVPVLRGEVGGLAALVGPRGAKGPAGTMPRAGRTGTELASRSPERPSPPEGPKEITSSIGMKLVLIPSGEFLMGSPDSDKDAFDNENPQHRVRITRPFYLGATEVTQGQYRAVTGENPSHFKGSDDLPVEKVSWNDAIAFCNKLSEREGLRPYYQFGEGARSGGDGYRLPTEAEWEYACRAGPGGTGAYGFGDDAAQLGRYAWYVANSGDKTHAVGQKAPNAWGLYDMHGNLLEWCGDGFAAYEAGPAVDPFGPLQAPVRVIRGGSWLNVPRFARSAYRYGLAPEDRYDDLGFRVARVRSGG